MLGSGECLAVDACLPVNFSPKCNVFLCMMVPTNADRSGVSLELVRQIILSHGWNTTCYQILNPGMNHWVGANNNAAAGYVEVGRHILIAGAPVCSQESIPQVISELRDSFSGKSLCFVGAEGRLTEFTIQSNAGDTVALGSQPMWRPESWLRQFDSHSSLREQRRRARAKGVVISEWSEDQAHNHPGLRQCLQAWLARKPIPNMRFLVEPDVFQYWGERRLFAAEVDGQICGFVVLCPIPCRNGWLTEDFIRHPSAPNGTIELTLYEAIKTIAAEGADLLTMGMCPLSKRSELKGHFWLKGASWLARSFGSVFYSFAGLEEFKAKFRPDYWEAVTVVRFGGRFRLSDLVAVVQAFTGYHPFLLPWRYAKKLAERRRKHSLISAEGMK